MIDRSQTVMKSVAANTTDWTDFVVPNGKTIRIKSCFGSANYTGTTSVALVWDRDAGAGATLLFITYGSFERRMNRELTGNGSKKLSVRLKNTSASAVELACMVDVVELD